MTTPKKFPMQPIEKDIGGTPRFVRNRVVDYLLTHGNIDMNRLAQVSEAEGFTDEDRMQFAQLIGYSVSGYGDLSYVTEASCTEADRIAAKLRAASKKGKVT